MRSAVQRNYCNLSGGLRVGLMGTRCEMRGDFQAATVLCAVRFCPRKKLPALKFMGCSGRQQCVGKLTPGTRDEVAHLIADIPPSHCTTDLVLAFENGFEKAFS